MRHPAFFKKRKERNTYRLYINITREEEASKGGK